MTRAADFEWHGNARHGTPGIVVLNAAGFRRARREITAWPGYAPTPLVALPALAAGLGIAALHVKDEGARFGLGSFKALGGAYAVLGVVQAELARRGAAPAGTEALEGGGHPGVAGITVCCATDGNHGRSVAWGARRFGADCVIFVHPHVSAARVAAIAAEGARIVTVPGTYDDAVRAAAAAAAANRGWFVVSDTSWPGYTDVPREVMQGYRLMADEALQQLRDGGEAPPTHVFVQAGVGGVAAAVSVQNRARLDPVPVFAVVEPAKAACLLGSARRGAPVALEGALDTVMGCLACGEPSLLAWQELERAADAFLAVDDALGVEAMRRLDAAGVRAGESGAAGLAGLMGALGDVDAAAALRLGPDSRVLLFNTEGAQDPEARRALLERGAPREGMRA